MKGGEKEAHQIETLGQEEQQWWVPSFFFLPHISNQNLKLKEPETPKPQ